MKICLCAGGTGGHVYPAVTLAKYLKETGDTFFFIGNSQMMEEAVCQQHNFRFLPIHNKGLFKNTFKSRFEAMTSTIRSFFDARKYLKHEKPDLVMGLGGYVTVPVGLAAFSLRIPLLLHEQNALPGKANKFLSTFSKGVALSYASSASYFKGKTTRLTGNPRASEVALQRPDASILKQYGLEKNRPILYIVMGSLGSGSMNRFLVELFEQFDFSEFQVLISGGVQNTQKLQKALEKFEYIHIYEQIDQVAMLPFCRVVLSRAGATGLAELMASGSIAILVPSPFVADNHQYYNALDLVEQQAAVMLEEKKMTPQEMYDLIVDLQTNEPKRQQLRENALRLAYPTATADIYQWMKELVND